MSTNRHPWLSCAWLLKNLQRAAKFKVKKSWAQSHRGIMWWVKLIQRIRSPNCQHDREFIHKKPCTNTFRKLIFYKEQRETSPLKGHVRAGTITYWHPTEPTSTAVTTQSKDVQFLLHEALPPWFLLKAWLSTKQSGACHKVLGNFQTWAPKLDWLNRMWGQKTLMVFHLSFIMCFLNIKYIR